MKKLFVISLLMTVCICYCRGLEIGNTRVVTALMPGTTNYVGIVQEYVGKCPYCGEDMWDISEKYNPGINVMSMNLISFFGCIFHRECLQNFMKDISDTIRIKAKSIRNRDK